MNQRQLPPPRTRLVQLQMAIWLMASGLSAWPQSSVYFNRSAFLNAAMAIPGNFQTISAFPPVNGPVVTISDLTFRGRYLVGSPNGILWNFDGSDPGLSVQFATGARAFGADFSSALSAHGYSSFTATISLNTGESFQFTAPTDPNFQFFGFVSPTPISSMIFSDGGLIGFGNLHEEMIRNVAAVTVPEPTGIVLVGVGAALLLVWRISRRKC